MAAENQQKLMFSEIGSIKSAKMMVDKYGVGKEETVKILEKIYKRMKLFRRNVFDVQKECKLDSIIEIATCYDDRSDLRVFVAKLDSEGKSFAVYRVSYGILTVHLQCKFISVGEDGVESVYEKIVK